MFFSRKRKKILRFISLQRGKVHSYRETAPWRRAARTKKILHQWTSQVVGSAIPRTLAPALAQSAASSLIRDVRDATDGWAPSKTHSLRCFQISQVVRRAAEARPFRSVFGVACIACSHQAMREVSRSGGRQGILSHDRTSYQTWREKGQALT